MDEFQFEWGVYAQSASNMDDGVLMDMGIFAYMGPMPPPPGFPVRIVSDPS